MSISTRQFNFLNVLKRAPKTTAKAHEQLLKKNSMITRNSVHGGMRTLEDRELVRARSKYDKKLKRDVIVWELTDAGRDAIDEHKLEVARAGRKRRSLVPSSPDV